jgi:hypothetical protein
MFGVWPSESNSDLADCPGAVGPFLDADTRLSDAEIRAALLARGGALRLSEGGLVLEEVECWRGYVRADYLCAFDGALSVIEIKSDRDSLRRFDEQVRVYSAIADRVTLVVGWNLAAHVLRTAPWWWDVVLAERDVMSGVRFVPLRDGAPNPDITADALSAMLPMDEVRRLARSVGLAAAHLRGRQLRQLVATHLPHEDLRTAVGGWLARLSQQRAGILS